MVFKAFKQIRRHLNAQVAIRVQESVEKELAVLIATGASKG